MTSNMSSQHSRPLFSPPAGWLCVWVFDDQGLHTLPIDHPSGLTFLLSPPAGELLRRRKETIVNEMRFVTTELTPTAKPMDKPFRPEPHRSVQARHQSHNGAAAPATATLQPPSSHPNHYPFTADGRRPRIFLHLLLEPSETTNRCSLKRY
ncbi:uncharacterized protein PV06_04791 [Exophiala oligosperma]|uniref:Uncharacterized protein n=1 Tax=Exophiala oligosperma TaxID=215243 RepID=A0A0D2E7B7_9EURO|nr:uncharacterized protein PV06_04791 [Exophiala oligosperma]KIW43719.1 hypothetical protein PV06_04791 [Exophiala oligosperma]